MSCRTIQLLLALALSATSALIAVGCASRPVEHVPDRAPAHPSSPQLIQRIAQLRFGGNARFALCVEPACPSLTRKTLARNEPLRVALPPEPPAVEPPRPIPAERPSTSTAPLSAAPASTAIEPHPHTVLVHFHSGKAELTDSSRATLRSSIALARASERILISGRTDAVGDDALNQALAFARALAVRDYLRTQMPDLPGVIAISARGNCCFIADNTTATGRSQNRRVEVVFRLRGEVQS